MTSEFSLEELARSLFTVTRRSGPHDLMAVCPFHTKDTGEPESTGSLAFSIQTGCWYCHTCGERGGLRTLLRKLGYSLSEVDEELLQYLQALAPHKPRSPLLWSGQMPNPLPEAMLGLFDTGNMLPGQMVQWGFRGATIRHFDVGYDPKHVRITFPLRDALGALVGFSGRALGDHPARYKVYGELEYEAWGASRYKPVEKGKLIWNYDRVYPALERIHDADIYVTEGFKACMWLWQQGFRNVVALLGSSMTDEQQALLERLGGVLYLFLDNDKAGRKKFSMADRLVRAGCDVRIPVYPTKQPDQLDRQQILSAKESAPVHVAAKKEENDAFR